MTKEILISPKELYYLGSMLQASYIDYAYVAAMEDIGNNYELFEKETAAQLVKKGILIEDFSGNMQVSDVALALLKPIFFGTVETALDVCSLGEKSQVDVSKYHFHEGQITSVHGKGENLFICEGSLTVIREKVETIVREDYSCKATEKVAAIKQEDVTRFVSVKSLDYGNKAVVKVYVEANDVMCQELEDGTVESLTRDMFVEAVYDVLKGV